MHPSSVRQWQGNDVSFNLGEMLPVLTGKDCWCFWCFEPEAESRVVAMLEDLYPGRPDDDTLSRAKAGRLTIEPGQLPGFARRIVVIFTGRRKLSNAEMLPIREKHFPEIAGEPPEGYRVLGATATEHVMVYLFLEEAKAGRILKTKKVTEPETPTSPYYIQP
jgi:hypothetical protein